MKRLFTRFALAATLALTLAGTSVYAQDQDQSAPKGRMRGGQRMDPDRQADMMAKRLQLSDDQKNQLKPILSDRQDQMKSLMADNFMSKQDRRSKMQSIMESTDTKVKGILNDDQKTKYDAMQAKMKERRTDRQNQN